jgi:hypothetical protein
VLAGLWQARAVALEESPADDHAGWSADVLDWNTSPVDLSFLNAGEMPAGRRGFVSARGDKLSFADGTPARFWGTNLTSYALFGTSRDNVKRQAHRLSQLGFNLVRLHHHDSAWVDPNIFGAKNARDTQSLDASMLEKLDWWIKCLKDEGIYVWLDLTVGRRFKAGDGIDDFDAIRKGEPTAALSGYNFVNDSIRRAMQRFNAMYLDHRNAYTGLRYKDDAAIAALLIVNEDDVTHHFGNALLPDKGTGAYSTIYLREANAFADRHGLPRDRVWRAWEDGPSKVFLNDLEQRFDTEMLDQLHALGVKAPIVTTSSWGHSPLSSLPALTLGDVIDVHSYGGFGELAKNPLVEANLLDWIAAARVVNKPLTVTEWGIDSTGSLVADRQSLPLYMAASASMQAWSAMMFYAYAQQALNEKPTSSSVYECFDDPALLASMPAAALLYRRNHVREAATTYVFAPDREILFAHPASASNSVALRTAAERGKLAIAMPSVPELPWLRGSVIPPGATMLRDPNEAQIPPAATGAGSDSGELERNWDRGTFTIDTPRSQAAMGRIGGDTIHLADVEITLTTESAVVAVQSMDGSPIRRSKRIMISVGGRAETAADKSLPFYSEPLAGRILIRARPGLKLGIRDARSGKVRQARARYARGRYLLSLGPSLTSPWMILSAGG